MQNHFKLISGCLLTSCNVFMRLRKAAAVAPQKHITDGIDKVEKRLMNCKVAKSYRKKYSLLLHWFSGSVGHKYCNPYKDTKNNGIFRVSCLRTARFYKYKYSVFFTRKEMKVNTSFSKCIALQMLQPENIVLPI